MAKKTIKIITESVCDLPRSLLRSHDIDIIHFEIATAGGVFTDQLEITAENVLELLTKGQTTQTSPASPAVYREVFERHLASHDELVLLSTSSHVSQACANAREATEALGEAGRRVHVFDSGQVSAGLGLMVLQAARLAASVDSAESLLIELEAMKPRVCMSFITPNADSLLRNRKISPRLQSVCAFFSLHPVMIMKDGRLVMKSLEWGDYEKACRRYLRKILPPSGKIDTRMAFLMHAECRWETIRTAMKTIARYGSFDSLRPVSASATSSSNSGPNAMGIAFLKK